MALSMAKTGVKSKCENNGGARPKSGISIISSASG
jgi:hypothetical protein